MWALWSSTPSCAVVLHHSVHLPVTHHPTLPSSPESSTLPPRISPILPWLTKCCSLPTPSLKIPLPFSLHWNLALHQEICFSCSPLIWSCSFPGLGGGSAISLFYISMFRYIVSLPLYKILTLSELTLSCHTSFYSSYHSFYHLYPHIINTWTLPHSLWVPSLSTLFSSYHCCHQRYLPQETIGPRRIRDTGRKPGPELQVRAKPGQNLLRSASPSPPEDTWSRNKC